jgi:hypothetical protein
MSHRDAIAPPLAANPTLPLNVFRCQQVDHGMFNRAARARSCVAIAVTMNGQQHGLVARAPSAVKHPGANVCHRAKLVPDSPRVFWVQG